MSDPTRPAREQWPGLEEVANNVFSGDFGDDLAEALDEIDTLRAIAIAADWLVGPTGIDPDVLDDVNTRSPFTYGALRGLEDAVREWRVRELVLRGGYRAGLDDGLAEDAAVDVLAALERLGYALHARPAFSKTTLSALETLGIDPSMPVARLRADLAIAARARACSPCGLGSKAHASVSVDTGNHCHTAAAGLLAYLLNGEQPHV